MPPKKSKVKKVNLTPGKVYEFLTREELQAKEQKYVNHITNLKHCLNYIKESSDLVDQLNEKQLISNKWQDYVNCFPLPKAYKPSDIRLSMEKLKFFEKRSRERTMDWLLSVDQRSVLNQNLFRKDLTRSTLRLKNKTNFGLEYIRDIDFCLHTLKRIDCFLDNNLEVAKCGAERLDDIKSLKRDIQQEIAEFFNRFTYRILCSEEAYMITLDPITSEYSFQTENFKMHIWSLKNVPIRFKHLEVPHVTAKLHAVKVLLHIPTVMMQQNFTIRALHMNFDHISENAKSYLLETTVPFETLSAEIQDLCECMASEWLMHSNIQNRVRNEMIEKHLEYKEELRHFEEREAKEKSKDKEEQQNEGSSKGKKRKRAKPPREPLDIEDDMFPDIKEDFLEEEQKQYKDLINAKYNPQSINLDSYEINLRKFFILGGIYQLYQVQKPKHFDINGFNMTWHCNNSELIVDEHLHIPLYAKLYQRRSKVLSSLTGKSLSLKAEEFKDSDPRYPWFVLTIQLPEYLCYWGEPIACHYENVTKVKQKQVFTVDVEETSKQLIESVNLETEQTELGSTPVSKYLPFLVPQKGGLSDSILNLERLSQETFFRTFPSNVRLAHKGSPIQNCILDSEGVLSIHDFPLNALLNKAEMRNIQRHVVPRIISSFKFSKELREDELLTIQGKNKTKGGLLLRKRSDETNELNAEKNHGFTFGPIQNNPERIIAFYPPDEPIHILLPRTDSEEKAVVHTKEPKSLAELIKLINFIKWQYKVRVRKILDLKPFKSRFPVVNKRLEALRKQQQLTVAMNVLRFAHLSKSRSRLHAVSSSNKKFIGSKHLILEPSESNIVTTALVDSSSETHLTQCNQDGRGKEGEMQDHETYSYFHWTTQHILKSDYDKEKQTVVIQTNRLGYFGFAFKQYEHFPFKFWRLEPNQNNPEYEVIFTLDTQHVRCVLYINEKGIMGHVTEPTTKYIRNPKMYLVIEEPIADFKELKKTFKEKNLNIFADKDACFYIENGYFSEKHLSTELHTYNCMALNSTQIKFSHSHWNPLAQRRDIILRFLQYQDAEEDTVEVRITPEEAFFVETSELCSDNVDVIKLNYNLTWRNISPFSDLYHLVSSMYPAANELRCQNPKLINFLRNLLYEIRPLSFS